MRLWDYWHLTGHPGAYDVPWAGAEPGLRWAHAEAEPLAQAFLLHASKEKEDVDHSGPLSVCPGLTIT